MNSSNHITVMSFYAKHRRTGCYKIGSYSFAQLESSGHLVVLIQHIFFSQKIYIQVYLFSFRFAIYCLRIGHQRKFGRTDETHQ